MRFKKSTNKYLPFLMSLTICIALLVSGTSQADPQNGPFTLGFKHLGPVKLGMTVQQAEKALNTKLEMDTSFEGEDCRVATPEDIGAGFRLMLHQGKIVRIDLTNPSPHKTLKGIGVGDKESLIKARYHGHYQIKLHHYDTVGHYITLYAPSPKSKHLEPYALRFETDGNKVMALYSGLKSFVLLPEGCH
ncbi:MAG: hypothetical protein K2X66_05975 [Cyanobacteria bacterium]|nr:hypothetical protein [Cyanobacteriota bacterium]